MNNIIFIFIFLFFAIFALGGIFVVSRAKETHEKNDQLIKQINELANKKRDKQIELLEQIVENQKKILEKMK